MSDAPMFDPNHCAALLLDCWRTGRLLDRLPPDEAPATLRDGYDAQDALFLASRARRAGWKLGVGSPAAMRAGNLSRPLVGQLDAARLHRSGAIVVLPDDAAVTIECEIAFILECDIAPDERPHPSAVIGGACVTFEVVRSRFVDPRAAGWPSFAADNVGFEALVVSEPVPLDQLRAVNDSAVVLLDGEPAAGALTGDAATDPMASLAALIEHAAERGITLKRGDLVTTGAMCKPFRLHGRGHELTASFTGGSLRFRL